MNADSVKQSFFFFPFQELLSMFLNKNFHQIDSFLHISISFMPLCVSGVWVLGEGSREKANEEIWGLPNLHGGSKAMPA